MCRLSLQSHLEPQPGGFLAMWTRHPGTVSIDSHFESASMKAAHCIGLKVLPFLLRVPSIYLTSNEATAYWIFLMVDLNNSNVHSLIFFLCVLKRGIFSVIIFFRGRQEKDEKNLRFVSFYIDRLW